MIATNDRAPEPCEPFQAPKFQPGQLVRHKRYGYRGVIVAVDPYCTADPEWYFRNKTQPNRDQPWYHVLVHGGCSVTYPAEENLLADPSSSEIEHPLVVVFFDGMDGLGYIRNNEPWPGQ